MRKDRIRDRVFDQLGLPPMELAEQTKLSDRRSSYEYIQKYVYSLLQKILVIIMIATFVAGSYILLLKILQYVDSPNAEIIVVTELDNHHNVTVQSSNLAIYVQMKNMTTTFNKRKKRHTSSAPKYNKESFSKLQGDALLKAREIIKKHKLLCRNKKQEMVCKDLISKLKNILDNSAQKTKLNEFDENIVNDRARLATSKREAHPMLTLQQALRSPDHQSYDAGAYLPEEVAGAASPYTDTCLLARLLKKNYPHIHGIYDPPTPEYSALHYEQPSLPHSRYFPSPYLQSRDTEPSQRKIHPQDLEIFMRYLTPKPLESSVEDVDTKSTVGECPVGTKLCGRSSECVHEKHWCDGSVDCADASDELRCSCVTRVDKSRLCDGYFDCPFGEDEMGCFGCTNSTFSCEDLDGHLESTCFTKEQRCNNVVECPNHRDEIDCNMLFPSIIRKPFLATSNTEGYLHRNFKGDWYPVCENPYMWAHDACRRETGLMIRPPFMQYVPIDPLSRVTYLSTGPGAVIETGNSCFNSSAVYVTCPDFLCGTRAQSTSHLIRENIAIENQIFGRNKRYLFPNRPYPFMFYDNRMKREISTKDDKPISTDESKKLPSKDDKSNSSNESKNKRIENDQDTSSNESNNKKGEDDKSVSSAESKHKKVETDNSTSSEESRNKRANSRVVGGQPSQPSSWPWMVAIYRDGMFHCGGVILTQNWVISAAHCVSEFWDHYYEVQVGMLRRFSFSPQEQNRLVAHIIVNKHYSRADMKDDLSLLKVEPAIQFSRWVRPICLPGPHTVGPEWLESPATGTICTAVGWGATEEHGPDPDHLREVEVPIWRHCKHQEDIAGQEICAGLSEGGKDACQGDSGGPLLCRSPLNSQQWYLAGIVSHGDGCARKNEPGVYTRVSLFVQWIKHHTLSKSLPIVQPLQICPGFKCRSGISRCLPNSRRCDKVVDCLDGDDEINCEFMRSAESKNSTITPVKQVTLDKSKKKSSEENNSIKTDDNSSKSSSSESDEYKTITTTTATKISERPTTVTSNVTKNIVHDTTVTPTTAIILSNENTNFDYTKLPENSQTQTVTEAIIALFPSTDSFGKNVELTASDSITTTEAGKTDRGDLQIAVDFPVQQLESRSSILEDLETESSNSIDKKARLLDIDDENLPTLSTEETTPFTKQTEVSEFDQSTTKFIIFDDTFTEKIPDIILSKNNSSVANEQNTTNNQITTIDLTDNLSKTINTTTERVTESTTTSHQSQLAKELPDFEGNIKKIEKILFSEFEPAKIRRKHRIPKEFECGRIPQNIPFHNRCDHKADCEDGTDELECTCVDYLATFDPTLLCDGIFDCADGQDELDCFACADDRFLCKQSQTCLPIKNVCDGKLHCPQGEDEMDCFALSNGKNMLYDIDERPKINLEGYLTRKHKNDWNIVCEDKLTAEQKEQTANHICHYLGFSSANSYDVKYVNIKDDQLLKSSVDDKRKRRDAPMSSPIHFTYKQFNNDHNEAARHIVINEPQVLQEKCVPNITKTCKSLYVYCDHTLTDSNLIDYFDAYVRTANNFTLRTWPWVAKVYADGDYKCTGVLVDLSWVIVSDSCLWDVSMAHNYLSVVLGSHRTLSSVNGMYEKVYKIDAKKELYRNKITLLHMLHPTQYSNMVKPMVIPPPSILMNEKTVCVAIGQDDKNNTVSIFLEETDFNCTLHNRCFKIHSKSNVCKLSKELGRQWSGIISCHDERGWYPAASFVDSRGECNLGDFIVGTDIDNLRKELKYYSGQKPSDEDDRLDYDACEGTRCSRGRCMPLRDLCDGVKNCEDGNDESEEACLKKQEICRNDPYHFGCECTLGQMKCRNGKCISKELFRDGNDDCGDSTDEPRQSSCADYLARVTPSRLCDGTLHCFDRSDEDPMFCKCFAARSFRCVRSGLKDHCVALDVVCDGVADCPGGEDEKTCIALSAPDGTPHGSGQVVVRSHGVWHSKCFPSQNHTRSELEAICKDLGYIGGHARKIDSLPTVVNPHNSFLLDQFATIALNNNTLIKMRNSPDPIAKPVTDHLKDCYPVFIECR